MTALTFNGSEKDVWGIFSLSYEGNKYQFPYYRPTGEIYNFDPDPLIRLKCVWIAIATPPLCLCRSIYWLAQSIFMLFAEAYRDARRKSSDEAWMQIKEVAVDSARALQYGFILTGLALWGIVFPFSARIQYGQAERELNRHVECPHHDKFYLARCFQPVAFMPKDYPKHRDELVDRFVKRVIHMQG